jgi:hypothetical protein
VLVDRDPVGGIGEPGGEASIGVAVAEPVRVRRLTDEEHRHPPLLARFATGRQQFRRQRVNAPGAFIQSNVIALEWPCCARCWTR